MIRLAQQLHRRKWQTSGSLTRNLGLKLTFRAQGLITPPLVQNTGFGAYVFFAAFCFLSFGWTFYFVPETNGKTLEQMDEVFRDYSNTEEMERKSRLFAETIRERANATAPA